MKILTSFEKTELIKHEILLFSASYNIQLDENASYKDK